MARSHCATVTEDDGECFCKFHIWFNKLVQLKCVVWVLLSGEPAAAHSAACLTTSAPEADG